MKQNRSQLPPLVIGTSLLAIYKQEEPCEVRVSSTVLWERGGEIPLRDPIVRHAIGHPANIKFLTKS